MFADACRLREASAEMKLAAVKADFRPMVYRPEGLGLGCSLHEHITPPHWHLILDHRAHDRPARLGHRPSGKVAVYGLRVSTASVITLR